MGGPFGGENDLRRFLARVAGNSYIAAMYCALPVLPLLASLVFWRRKYVTRYGETFAKAKVHIAAMQRGPAVHYFQDVLGQVKSVPDTIEGECIQCGNCCMNHQCMFLEQVAEDRFLCGIYHSPFRAWSNCGSFPLNRHDIDRYACPSYFVPAAATRIIPIYSAMPVAPPKTRAN